jgi:methionine synthase (B12-dependent) (EC 2.1.1.13)
VISGQLNSDFVLCIDSKEPEIIEEALKNYAGKALINSVALDEKELEEILPLAKNMVLV